MKFGRQEIGEIVCYLPDKISTGSPGVATARIVPKICQYDVLRVLQISSKSIHFRQSYSLT